MAYQELLGRFYLGGTLNNFSVEDTGGGGAQAVTLTAGYYYMHGYTGEGTANLIEHMQAQVRALGGVWATAAFSRSLSTGYVTLNCPGTTTVTWTWTDAALQTALGFTGAQSGAKTYTGTQVPRYCWHPSRALTDYPGNATKIWQPKSTTVVGRSSGAVSGAVGSVLYNTLLTWSHLAEAEILEPASGTIGGDLESFFEDVAHEAQPIRIVVDRSSYASTSDYVTAMWGEEDKDEIGAFEEYRERHVRRYQGRWMVETPFMKWV